MNDLRELSTSLAHSSLIMLVIGMLVIVLILLFDLINDCDKLSKFKLVISCYFVVAILLLLSSLGISMYISLFSY